MNERDFAYWLMSYVELIGLSPTEDQWEVIVTKLRLVFEKVTPEIRPRPTMLDEYFTHGITP